MSTERIPVELDEIPQFGTEAEEQAFWSTHEHGPGIVAQMGRHRDPRLPPPSVVRESIAARRASPERTQPIPIRFDADVIKRLRVLAEKKQTGYQTLLKLFVAERLYEEEKREGII